MMNNTAKLAHFKARRREGDVTLTATKTGYSISHISNMLAGRRTMTPEVANTLYQISSRRNKNLKTKTGGKA
jgi:hypothetical protein